MGVLLGDHKALLIYVTCRLLHFADIVECRRERENNKQVLF